MLVAKCSVPCLTQSCKLYCLACKQLCDLSLLLSFIHLLGPCAVTLLICVVQSLAKKMTVLYKLAHEQLSKQHHYDFGLRALKSVLVMAGALKRGAPGMSEQLVLMRALRDMNLPKFVYDDVPLFLGLINDLFPGKSTEASSCCSWPTLRTSMYQQV